MIEIRDLDFRYPRGEFRLNIPALSIAKGDRVAIIGPSGSGKTTLLHLMAGILLPRAGSLTLLTERIGADLIRGLILS